MRGAVPTILRGHRTPGTVPAAPALSLHLGTGDARGPRGPDPPGRGWHPRRRPAHRPRPVPADPAAKRAATMPDSPADVKTQPRSTPPSMPPPPPAVTQGATRHPSFTPSTSEYGDGDGDGDGMGWRAGRLPGSLGHALPSGSVATSSPCAVLAVPWGGDPRSCAGEGLWAACALPTPSEVLGDRDVLVSCCAVTKRGHGAACAPPCTELLEEAAGLGAGHGHVGACGTRRCGAVSRLVVVVGTCWLCPGDRAVASGRSAGTCL